MEKRGTTSSWEVETLISFEVLRNPPQYHRVAFQQTTVLSNIAVSQNSQSCSSYAGVNFSVLLRQFIPNCIEFIQEMKHLSYHGEMLPFLETFYYQLMHIILKNTELLKHSKITLQHVSVYIETIFRELKSVLG